MNVSDTRDWCNVSKATKPATTAHLSPGLPANRKKSTTSKKTKRRATRSSTRTRKSSCSTDEDESEAHYVLVIDEIDENLSRNHSNERLKNSQLMTNRRSFAVEDVESTATRKINISERPNFTGVCTNWTVSNLS